MNKELIEKYYKMGLFTLNDLSLFVKSGYLTEKEKETILKYPINVVKLSNEYQYTFGMYYSWKNVNYHCLDVNSITPSESYGQMFTSKFTPDMLVGRFFEVVA